MKHLDDSTAIAFLEGRAEPTARAHAQVCERCRCLVRQYETLLATIASDRAPKYAPPAHLMRWARAFAAITAPPRPTWRLLPLLARGTELLATVRGDESPGAGAYLFGDDSHHLDIRIEATHTGSASLHGQLIPLTESQAEPQLPQWSVTVVTVAGETKQTTTDEVGEFWLDGLSSWQGLDLVAHNDQERILVQGLGRDGSASAGS